MNKSYLNKNVMRVYSLIDEIAERGVVLHWFKERIKGDKVVRGRSDKGWDCIIYFSMRVYSFSREGSFFK